MLTKMTVIIVKICKILLANNTLMSLKHFNKNI